MSEMGVKSIKDHNLHLISLFHGKSRWSWYSVVSVYLRSSNLTPGINTRAEFLCYFLSLSSSVLKLQLNWGSNLWCDEERKPRAAPLALELTEAVDRICGLIEMMCSISHPNELYYIIGYIVINQKNIHLGTLDAICVETRRFFCLMHVHRDCFRTFYWNYE